MSNANKLSTLGPTLGWVVAGKDGRLYALRSGTGGNFNTGIVVELDPSTGAVLRTLASNLTCPQGWWATHSAAISSSSMRVLVRARTIHPCSASRTQQRESDDRDLCDIAVHA